MTLAAAVPGGWSLNQVLQSSEMNALQNELLKALDGVGGGTYALGAPLIFGAGSDVRFGNRVQLLGGGELQLVSGSDLNALAGSEAVFAGLVLFSGLSTQFSSFAEVTSTGRLLISPGGELDVDGDMTLLTGSTLQIEDLNSLVVADQSFSFRVVIAPADIEEDGAGERTWSMTAADSDGFFLQIDVSPPSGAEMWIPLRIEPGDDIVSIVFSIQGGAGGGHVALPAGMPEVALVAVGIDVATATDSSASVGAYDATHTITLSGGGLPHTATDNTYFLRINGERSTNAINGELRLLNIQATCIRRRLVSTEQM